MASMTIPLTRGWIALVDEDDFPKLSRFKWHVRFARSGAAYAATNDYPQGRLGGEHHMLTMHRIVLGASPGQEVDHVQRTDAQRIIDNRKKNLRFCSRRENNANSGKRTRCSSIFKGVSRARSQRWQVFAAGQRIGNFLCEGYAALAYDLAAVALYGRFAFTNFPVPGSERWLFGLAAEKAVQP